MNDRRGVALVLVLAASVLVGSLTLVALHAVAIRVRLVSDARWRIEGALIASSALAQTRLAHRADLDTLADGAALTFPTVARPDGWSWYAGAARRGAVIRITVVATRRATDGNAFAAHRTSLLLTRDPADTVRVLAQRARF